MADKPLIWLYGEVKTSPFSVVARMRAGFLLRELQSGAMLTMPDSRPMPSIGRRCFELRIVDFETDKTWRVLYRIDSDAIIIVKVLAKKTQKTQKTPQRAIDICKKRLREYDRITKN